MKRAIYLLLVLASAACAPAASPPPIVPLRIGVTPETRPLVEAWLQTVPAAVTVVDYTSHRQLLRAVEAGGVAAGFSCISEPAGQFVQVPLAQTALAIFGHPALGLAGLTRSQLQAIVTGAVTEWSAFGAGASTVKIAYREEGSAARRAFEQWLLEGKAVTPAARVLPNAQAMIEYVAATPGAVGYAWLSELPAGSAPLAIDERHPGESDYSALTTVVAIAYSEPQGRLREWLAAVQRTVPAALPRGLTALPYSSNK